MQGLFSIACYLLSFLYKILFTVCIVRRDGVEGRRFEVYSGYFVSTYENIKWLPSKFPYRETSSFARALRSMIEWITGTMKIATIPPANPLLYKFMPPYTIPTFRATEE